MHFHSGKCIWKCLEKWRPCCLGLNVLIKAYIWHIRWSDSIPFVALHVQILGPCDFEDAYGCGYHDTGASQIHWVRTTSLDVADALAPRWDAQGSVLGERKRIFLVLDCMGIDKTIFPCSFSFPIFKITETLATHEISHSYLTGVSAVQLRWHLLNMNVILRPKHVFPLNQKHL